MEKNPQKKEGGISLLDVLHLLLSKIKLLILVVLVGGLLGGAFAVVRTMDVDEYGTRVEFYVNPEKPVASTDSTVINSNGSQYGVYGAYGRHVMDNMVKLLNSNAFTEQLLLGGDYLPEKDVWTNEKEAELATKLNAAIDAATESVNALKAAETALANKEESAIDAIQEYNKAMIKLNTAWADVSSSTFNEENYEEKIETMAEGDKKTALVNAYNAMLTARSTMITAQGDITLGQTNVNIARKSAQPFIDEALELWSKTARYKNELRRYSSNVRFSYLLADEDPDDANNLARSFIYANISVLNDEAFANELYDAVKKYVPIYVEENMTVPAGYEGTNCQRITRSDDVHLTNANYTLTQAIKYAIVFAAAAFAIASVILVIIDKSDKRLRDYEIITKEFNVPILGIVPSIDMDAEKKKSGKNADEEGKK